MDRDNLEYWKDPGDNNIAENYLDNEKMRRPTAYLVSLMRQYAKPKDSILELGCNVGRNLNALYDAGFTNVTGIEISEKAVKLGESTYPNIKGKIRLSSIEDTIKDLKKFDIVFTRAVLEHITTKSQWIFPEIERITKKYLITIEDERNRTWKHFPRNYKNIFTNLEQVYEKVMTSDEGLPSDFILRVFKKHARI